MNADTPRPERVTRHVGDKDARTPGAIRRPFIPEAQVAGPPTPRRHPSPSDAAERARAAIARPQGESND